MKNIFFLLVIVLIPTFLYAGIRLTQGRLEDFQVDGVASVSSSCDTGYSPLVGSDSNNIIDSTGGVICCPDS